jgi:hypothetical protein
MIQNLEFIADSEALKKYQIRKHIKLPFKIHNTRAFCCSYESLLSIINQKTNRYVKQNQSHKKNAWKYTAILPHL